MKEIKFLDRVQAVLHFYVILILATIQEYSLKSELSVYHLFHTLLQCNPTVTTISPVV